jgi:histidine ammonia-lyase
MATHGARRLSDMVENTAHIVAIELMAAAQGVDLRRPLATSPRLQRALSAIRERVAFLHNDRLLAGDITALAGLVLEGRFSADFPAAEGVAGWLAADL